MVLMLYNAIFYQLGKFFEDRSNVFSISSGKQQAGSSRMFSDIEDIHSKYLCAGKDITAIAFSQILIFFAIHKTILTP
jgi:hypothetical protein